MIRSVLETEWLFLLSLTRSDVAALFFTLVLLSACLSVKISPAAVTIHLFDGRQARKVKNVHYTQFEHIWNTRWATRARARYAKGRRSGLGTNGDTHSFGSQGATISRVSLFSFKSVCMLCYAHKRLSTQVEKNTEHCAMHSWLCVVWGSNSLVCLSMNRKTSGQESSEDSLCLRSFHFQCKLNTYDVRYH